RRAAAVIRGSCCALRYVVGWCPSTRPARAVDRTEPVQRPTSAQASGITISRPKAATSRAWLVADGGGASGSIVNVSPDQALMRHNAAVPPARGGRGQLPVAAVNPATPPARSQVEVDHDRRVVRRP